MSFVNNLFVNNNAVVVGDLDVRGTTTASSIVKSGGTNIQYLMADGSTLTQSATSGNSNFYLYDNTNSTTDSTPVSGEVIINSLVNTTATIVYISHVTRDNIDVEVFWKFVNTLTELYLQDQSLSTNFIQYNITAAPTITVGDKIAIPVSVVNSGGTGSTSFGAGHNILVSFFTNNLEVDTRLSTLETKTTNISYGAGGTMTGDILLNSNNITGTTGLIQGFNIPALDTRMSNVETKTQNQISIANSTTFSGNINFDTINTIITNLPTLSSNTAPTGYIASASTTGSFQPWLIFDNNNGTKWDSSNSVYNSVTGIYSGAVSTTVIDLGAILGEWFQIQTPNNITVTSYTYRSSGVSSGMNTFYLVYSSNGTTWNVADLRKSINYVSSDLSFTLVTPRTAKYWRYIVTVVGNTAETTLRTKCEVSKINFTLMSNPIVGVVSSDKTSFTSTQLVTKSYVDKLSNTAFNGYLPSTSINNIMDQPWKPIKRTYNTINMIWISAPINKFISVGNLENNPGYSRISYSSDGINWTDVSGLSGSYLLRSIAWSPNNGGLIVAIGDSNSQYATSTNGIDWTLRPQIVANMHIASIVYATTLGLFVAVGSSATTTDPVVITSPDGINWITRTIETTTRATAICWCPELSKLYIGCHNYGTPGNRIFSSLDGINWSLEAFISNCFINPRKIIYANNLGLFIMVGYNDISSTDRPSLMTSPNGTDWTYRATTTDSSKPNSWADVVWSPELNILIAITDANNNVDNMYSLDGITWKSFNSNNLFGGFAICWSKELGKFMYCAYNYIYSLSPNGYVDTELNNIEKKNNSIYSSIGGVGFKDSWLSSTGGTSSLITGIASNGTNVVLATSSGIKYSTNNGVSWVDVASSIANAGVIWFRFSFQILFIAKNATQYQTSINGISWTAAAATNAGGSFGKNNQQVSFKNMLISSNATVGSYIQTTTDSSTYTVRTAARPVSSMVLAKANIMTFGVSGCMISTDGITWTNDTLVTNIKASCYSETLNTIFAIPDGTSTLLKSKDSGVTWITLLNVFPVSISPQFIIWDDNIGLGFVFLETNNSTTVMTMYQFDKNGNVVGGSLVEQGLSSAISGGPNDGIYIPSLSRFIIARNSSLQPVYNVISNSIVSSGNITSYGTLKSSTSTLTPVIDRATAGVLSIGNTTATSITLGKTGIATTVPGTLNVNGTVNLTGRVMDSSIIPTIPSMTSNTTPSDFIMSASTNSISAYLAFDGNNETIWNSADGIYTASTGVYIGSVTTTSINTIAGVISIVGEWIQFQAVTPVSVSGYIYRSSGSARGMNTYYVVYSDNAVSWTLADSRTGINYESVDLNFTLAVPATAKYWRFIVTVVGNVGLTDLRTMVEVATIRFTLIGGLFAATQLVPKSYVDAGDALQLNLAGGTLTGQVLTNQTPSANNHLVPKSYVDTADALQLNLAGGALTGQVTTNQTAVLTSQLTAKTYVDKTALKSLNSSYLAKRSWVAKAMVGGESGQWYSVCWSSEKGLAVAVANTGNIMTSPDGLIWTVQTNPGGSWYDVCWSADLALFVIVANLGTNRIATSPDGVTWTVQTSPVSGMITVIWSKETAKFVAVGPNICITSVDGVAWVSRTIGNYAWGCACYSKELSTFVALSSSRVAVSSDGETWTSSASINSNTWTSVVWAAELGIFVAVSLNGTTRTATSSNGTSWTYIAASENTNNAWWKVVWARELALFVAVSYSGTNRVMTSPDALTWTGRTSGNESNGWDGLCWAREIEMLIAVAYGGTNRAMTSGGVSNGFATQFVTLANGATNTTIMTSGAASVGVVMKLPTNIGTAGQFLKTDGAGQCYWGDN